MNGGDEKDLLLETLRGRFGIAEFRPMQREAIEAAMMGRDSLVVMPTGGGKSLCYQLPALLFEGITLVVSPLIALMKDQVDRLTRLKIPAVALNSTLHFNQIRATLERAAHGDLKVIFVAPERLESPGFREALRGLPIKLIAIDEAHCISEWGHDFRTSYRRIPDVFDVFEEKRPPIMALTATATPEVRTDVARMLGLDDPLEIVTGFERPNISYGVLRESDKPARLLDMLKSLEGASAIVYTATRKSADKVTQMLRGAGYNAAGYHAGLSLEARRGVQERFQSGALPIIVATSAFGMGIDKPNIRAVIHYELPGSLEAYYQESGRVGRDGGAAMAILLYSAADVRTHEYLIRLSSPSEAEVRSVYVALHDIAGNAVGSIYPGPLTVDSALLLKYIVKPEASLERILDVLEELGHIRVQRLSDRGARPRVLFLTTRNRLEELLFRAKSPAVKTTLSALMRAAGAEAFTREVSIDEEELCKSERLKPEDFHHAVRTLVSLGVMNYIVPTRTSHTRESFTLELLTERTAPQRLNVPGAALRERMEHAMMKLQRTIGYATNWSCRTRTIMQYFGEAPLNPECGICDVCRAKLRHEVPEESIAVPANL